MTLETGEHLVEIHWTYGLAGSRDSHAGVWYFAARTYVQVAQHYIRQAISAYRATVAAEHFNWGDAIGDIPAEHWARYGLRLLSEPTPAESFAVDHDEQF